MKKISIIAFVVMAFIACGDQEGNTTNDAPAATSGTSSEPMVDSLGSGTVPGSVSSGDTSGTPATAPR